MKTKTNTLAIVVGMSLLLGAAGLSACANKVETAVKPCPCAAGFVCCESGVCAQDQSGCGQATAALSASARGEWTGYIENFQSVSSDDSIAISISAADDGTLSGTVRIGQGPPPPPATDGTVPWPPTLHGDAPVPLYIPGFVYSVEDISWQARRLKFRIPKYQPWQPWCALQQSYEYTHCDDPPGCTTIVSDGFYCLPTGGAVPDEQGNCSTVASATTPARAVDCAMGALCDTVGGCNCQSGGCNCGGLGVCECDASGCRVGREWMSVPIGFWFDVAFDGAQGNGSVNLSAGGSDLHNIRITRTGQVGG